MATAGRQKGGGVLTEQTRWQKGEEEEAMKPENGEAEIEKKKRRK